MSTDADSIRKVSRKRDLYCDEIINNYHFWEACNFSPVFCRDHRETDKEI